MAPDEKLHRRKRHACGRIPAPAAATRRTLLLASLAAAGASQSAQTLVRQGRIRAGEQRGEGRSVSSSVAVGNSDYVGGLLEHTSSSSRSLYAWSSSKPLTAAENDGGNRTLRDDPSVVPPIAFSRLDECGHDEQLLVFNFMTDEFGHETSWSLKHVNENGRIVGWGPPNGLHYGDLSVYSARYCLRVGHNYTLAVDDNFGDGMCCLRGRGGYEFYVGEVEMYSSNFEDTFDDYAEHTFTVSACPTWKPPDYRGTLSGTESGLECQAWSSQSPHQHPYTPAKYPELEGNYCRDPTGTEERTWCFTTDKKKEWDWCNVPECEVSCPGSDPSECGCAEVNQTDYRASISTTTGGLECQAWSDQFPHSHNFIPDDYQPHHGLKSNYCRNPWIVGERAWCFTSDPDTRWDYCDVPVCEIAPTGAPTVRSAPTGAPTVRSALTGAPTVLSALTGAPTVLSAPTGAPTVRSAPTGTPTESPTGSPTSNPIKSPTESPTRSPTSTPTNSPTMRPTSPPTNPPHVHNPDTGCYGGDLKFQVEIQTDFWGKEDTSWNLFAPNGTLVADYPRGFYGNQTHHIHEFCLPPGLYNFTVFDDYGNGLCCQEGEGYVKIYIDGWQALHDTSFGKVNNLLFNIGFDPTPYMNRREFDYLDSHNRRRKEWHESNNVSYVPLKYSPGLAKLSLDWAVALLDDCDFVGIEHELNVPYGENLAKNHGSGGWGRLYPADRIVTRWVEFEIGWPYPSNAHLTQALWRGAKYLGCGESVKPWKSGFCRVQVCRYGRAGNCDMSRFNSTEGENWLPPMLSDTSRCGPDCPPEGCF